MLLHPYPTFWGSKLGFVTFWGKFDFFYVDGVGIVQHSSEFYLPDESYSSLEFLSKHRCPGHGLVPARRVSWGGASSDPRFLGCPLDVSSCQIDPDLFFAL